MPNDDRDWIQILKDKEAERNDLNKRRDDDRKLVTSNVYEMLDSKDKKIADMINATTNRLKVFKAYVEASLNKADEKLYVTSNDTNIKTRVIEDIIWAGFRTADYRLLQRGDFMLNPFFDQQACMRGEGAARVVFQMVKGAGEDQKEGLDANITPWDTRFVLYEEGPNGMDYGAYKIKRSKAKIESEQWAIEADYKPSGKAEEIIDLWTPEENIVFAAGKERFRQPHDYGEPPVCVARVPIGSMLQDEDTLLYQMESIFFLVRGLIDEYNRCLSILQTLNLKAIKVALQEVVPEGAEAQEYNEIADMGSNSPVGVANAIQMIPYGDARRSMILALQELNKALNDGTLSRIMLGELPGELSAVALVQIEQGQGQVFMPRLGMRGVLKQLIAYKFNKQLLNLGGKFELGTPGHKRTFQPNDLEGEYEIEFKYANRSPETDYARLQMGTTWKEADLLDEKTILREILLRDDPEGDLNKLNRQRLRQLSPNLVIYDGLMALAEAYEAGDEDVANEINIVEAELGASLEAMMSGAQLPQLPGAKPQTAVRSATMPLGGKSSAQKAFELKATPADEGE